MHGEYTMSQDSVLYGDCSFLKEIAGAFMSLKLQLAISQKIFYKAYTIKWEQYSKTSDIPPMM